MKTIITFCLLVFGATLFAQQTISGTVVDNKSKPIAGANIYLDGTYDGASSDEKGHFSFTTTTTGNQTLVVSFLTFETTTLIINVADFKEKTIKMRESVNTLDAVVVTAGTMETGEKARVSVLKPLDIVTTAGSAGNIISALQTLPGTQSVGEDGRLFVRGGEADETQTFVDGIRVGQPYGASANNVPTRGRFSPFLFSGISFSTGGYSAEYGEALSSVLLLNTQDQADQNKTDVSFMTVGLGVGHTQKWKKSSLSFNTAYIDLAPYQWLIPQNVDWNRPYQSLSGETVYRYNTERGIFKLYAAFDAARFDINQESVNSVNPIRFNLENNNFYLNSSYKANYSGQWQFTSGLGYGYAHNLIYIDQNQVRNDEHTSHLKLKMRKGFSDRFKLSFGGDYFLTKFSESYAAYQGNTNFLDYHSGIFAAYSEGELFLSKQLGAKIGVRWSYNDLLKTSAVTPRVSMAYKFNKSSQFSVAYGTFEQTPGQAYLKFSKYHNFENEQAAHYILNFQYAKNKKTLRLEGYYKDYQNLIKYDTDQIQYNSTFSNTGSGYAKGIDCFWRDGFTFKNLEYWLSYSYIDTERDYKNFKTQTTPSFVANHSLSIVTKYWIDKWRSQLGLTQSFASGRPYTNPNVGGFLNQRTQSYSSLSFSWAYLLSQQKILYFSVSNVLGTRNVFGYEYANQPTNNYYNRREITPTADRFFFIGFFWTISDNKKDNQLNNL
ncbi:MAG: TonB-dependent receptor [Bacteroidetes bacterium]|nr:TonB-dependent receptor [Bacteroidota bacterium]